MPFTESNAVERRAAVPSDLCQTIVAFANTAGGRLFVGIDENGAITGLADPKAAATQILREARDAIRPDTARLLRYEAQIIEGKTVLQLDVQPKTKRPYYLARRGMRPEGVYVRQNGASLPATRKAVRDMLRDTGGDAFEERRSEKQNLTFDAVRKALAAAGLASDEPSLMLGFIGGDGLFTNLAWLLSEQCAHAVSAAVFAGITPEHMKERQDFAGPLLEQLDEITRFLHRSASPEAGLAYPEVAVRESLANLLLHRDYDFRATSRVSVYDDRIEFLSAGGLTLDDVQSGLSLCRNEKLSCIFTRLGLAAGSAPDFKGFGAPTRTPP